MKLLISTVCVCCLLMSGCTLPKSERTVIVNSQDIGFEYKLKENPINDTDYTVCTVVRFGDEAILVDTQAARLLEAFQDLFTGSVKYTLELEFSLDMPCWMIYHFRIDKSYPWQPIRFELGPRIPRAQLHSFLYNTFI